MVVLATAAVTITGGLVITEIQATVTITGIARSSEAISFSAILGISSGGIRIADMGTLTEGIIVAGRDIFVAMEVDTEVIADTIEHGSQFLNSAAFMGYIPID